MLLPLQPVTHWLPHSWQMKKGSVCEYCVMLGETLFSHTQLYVRASGSHSLSTVVMEVTPGCCRQMSGHWAFWLLHQVSGRVSVRLGESVGTRTAV